MLLDDRNYRDFAPIRLSEANIAHPSVVEVHVDPTLNNGADILCTYTGTLMFARKGEKAGWIRGSLFAALGLDRNGRPGGVATGGRKWTSRDREAGWTRFRDGSIVLSLAAVYNVNVANNAGWAVDAAAVELIVPVKFEEHLEIQALIAVSDTDGVLYRLSYQVTALGITSPGPVIGKS